MVALSKAKKINAAPGEWFETLNLEKFVVAFDVRPRKSSRSEKAAILSSPCLSLNIRTQQPSLTATVSALHK